jgi:hypothetical protein
MVDFLLERSWGSDWRGFLLSKFRWRGCLAEGFVDFGWRGLGPRLYCGLGPMNLQRFQSTSDSEKEVLAC